MADSFTLTSGTVATGEHSLLATPELITGGTCVTKTLAHMLDVPDSAKHAIIQQAEDLVEDVVRSYENEITVGEVGAHGSAEASKSPPKSEWCPTGLLYGRIQSGKTAAMITSTAMAIDNGFRVIVVLTTNFVELVKQTADRFRSVARALVHASTEREAWETDVENIKKHLGSRGLVIVCAKEPHHLESVRELLERIDAAAYPGIILDDEADQASLDNNTRKRAMSDDPDSVAPTKIHELIANLRKVLRHHVFLQVTATPFALLLQNVDSPARPRFTRLLEPGDGYTGGEHFFSEEHLAFEDERGPLAPLIFVDEQESEELEKELETPPVGLERAVAFFLVAAATQLIRDPQAGRLSQNFLCHTSHQKTEHKKLDTLIKKFLSDFEDELAAGKGRAVQLIDWGYEELKRTVDDLPSRDAIVEDIIDRLPRRRVRLINSDGKAPAEVIGAPNFIVGGNIVGRGLTIPNLLVTYYLRKPKISQMDTMLQHARMFGYRKKLMPLTRVFLPRSLAVRFNALHQAERELRALIPNVDALTAIPVQVVGELRPTRYGVLDTGSVVAFGSGQHVFPPLPPLELPKSSIKQIEQKLRELFGVDIRTQTDVKKSLSVENVPVDAVAELCELFESPDWNGDSNASVLKAVAKQCNIVFRPMDRKRRDGQGPQLLTGAISGAVLQEARSKQRPTFFVLRQLTPQPAWNDQQFLYPTLVFPEAMRSVVFNASPE